MKDLVLLICIAIAVSIVTIGAFVYLLRLVYLQFFGSGYFVKKAAKELGISEEKVKERFNAVLCEAIDMCFDTGKVLPIKHYFPRSKRDQLGAANANRKCIFYSPLWIYLVVAKPNLWKPAFLLSIGHELAHCFDPKRKLWERFFRAKAERRFYKWLCEVRNDFEGMKTVQEFKPDWSRKTLIRAMERKAKMYDKDKKPGKMATMSHPSWDTRIMLLKKYDSFNYDVVEEVAALAGCKNRKYIIQLTCDTTLPF